MYLLIIVDVPGFMLNFREEYMRSALYIDCSSVTVEDIPYIYEEIRKNDEIVVSKMFAGADIGEAYEKTACRYRIQSVRCGDERKSIPLLDMAVEVMADACMGNVLKMYIVTDDYAVVTLLEKLRLMEVDAVVIGSCKADRALIEKADRYIYLEILNGGQCTADIPTAEEIAHQICLVSSNYNGRGKNATLEQIYSSLIRKYPDFDIRNYGYTHLSKFVEKNVTGAQVVNDDGGEAYIKIIDDRKQIDAFAYDYVAGKGYALDDMTELLDALAEKFPGFAMENYGYRTDYGFILSFSRFRIWENKGIKMKRTFKLSPKTEEE